MIQGAAKSARAALERGEKLGINQAVRDAVGELRRNVQNLNDNRVAPRPQQGGDAAATLAAMDKRSKQLATFLNETVADLKALSASNLNDKVKSLQMIEVAAAKVQFVQIYLEDSTMDVPSFQEEAPRKSADSAKKGDEQSANGRDGARELDAAIKKSTGAKSQATETGPPKAAAEVPPAVPEKPDPAGKKTPTKPAQPAKAPTHAADKAPAAPPKPETKSVPHKNSPDKTQESAAKATAASSQPTAASGQSAPKQPPAAAAAPVRPQLPAVPTRSTIAQSSFSWMLEPDESTPSAAAAAADSKSPTLPSKKRISNNVSRERNAFLFGDGGEEASSSDPLASNGIFGLESIGKPKSK